MLLGTLKIIGTAYRLASHAGDEIRAPLKTPVWEATYRRVPSDDPRDNWATRFGSVSSVHVWKVLGNDIMKSYFTYRGETPGESQSRSKKGHTLVTWQTMKRVAILLIGSLCVTQTRKRRVLRHGHLPWTVSRQRCRHSPHLLVSTRRIKRRNVDR